MLGLGIGDVVGFFDVGITGGLLKGARLGEFARQHFSDRPIEQLAMPFATVATALRTGAEVWLRDGSTLEAVHASIALPGLFTPVRRDGAFLVDGGLVNPVPVSLARAMGGDLTAASDGENGATFTLTLPSADPTDMEGSSALETAATA